MNPLGLIIFHGNQLLLIKDGEKMRFPLPQETPGPNSQDSAHFTIGDLVAFRIPESVDLSLSLPHLISVGLRESFMLLPESDFAAASKAAELLYWDENTRFCSRCGAPLHRKLEISKICDSCGREYFPVMTPAILVLVTDGDKALLVHARNFSRPDMMALVAGFVETGETLEECVAREVKEETSLCIDNIRYFGSQSWPFPSQLMIAFTAEYAGGEIALADGELSSGGWFTRDNVPPLPTPPSLSRRLIDTWLHP